MNIEQMKSRLGEIVAKLGEYSASASYTDEEVATINDLNSEFESLQKNIETAEKVETMKAKAGTTTRVVAASPVATVGENRQTFDPKAGWKTQGEFFRAVANASNGRVDKRLTVQAGAQEKIGEDGGYLIPTDFITEIQNKVQGDQSLLSRTTQYKTSSNNLTIPTCETAPWDGTGIQAFWEGEANLFTESKGKYGQATMRLHKLTALVRVTDELLEDAPALQSYIQKEAPEAMLHKVNSAIIAGNGAGMPLGFLNSGFKFQVPKEAGQAVDTIKFENVNNMLGRILPMSFAKSVWLVNPAALPQLRLMKFDSAASSPVPVYLPPSGVAEAPYGTLYGRPIIPMMGAVKALGDEGDISLVDLSHYTTVLKTAGVKQDISTHVYFNTQETAFRFSMRLAGQCNFKAPVSTENGGFLMSGIVTLQDR